MSGWPPNLRHFGPGTDRVLDACIEVMDVDELYLLDAYRHLLGHPVMVWEAAADPEDGKHSDDSQHYEQEDGKCHAVDCSAPGVPLGRQYTVAERFGFGGIGLYPHWKHPGLHLDNRIVGKYRPAARWVRNRAGVYVGLDNIRGICRC